MIIVMKAHATEPEIDAVVKMVEGLDYRAHIIRGVERTVVACVGDERGEQHSLEHLIAVVRRRAGDAGSEILQAAVREVRPEGSSSMSAGSRSAASASR